MNLKSVNSSVVISKGKASKFLLASVLMGVTAAFNPVMSADSGSEKSAVEKGMKIATNRKLGNCLACHVIPNQDSPANIGPPLMGMKARFPDKAKLRAQIWDPRVNNPDTSMLPFGAHKILNDAQIDNLVEYLYTL